jgi:hypothetical protein
MSGTGIGLCVGARVGSGPTPGTIENCKAWVDFRDGILAPGGTTPTIDSTGEPQVFTTLPNWGSVGGTVGNTGVNRLAVGYIEAGGSAHRVGGGNGSGRYAFSDQAAASWSFLHETSTIAFLVRAPSTVPVNVSEYVSTYALGGADRGVSILARHGGNQDLLWRVGNGTTRRVDAASGAGVWAEGQVHLAILRIGDSAYDMRINGVSVASGVPLAAGVGAPLDTLNLGQRSGGTFRMFGQYGAFAAWDRYLEDGEVDLLDAWGAELQSNSDRTKKSPVFWFLPKLRLAPSHDPSAVVDTAPAVGRMWDLGGMSHDAVQATPAKQLDLVAPDADFAGASGSASVEGSGAEGMSVGAGVGWGLSVGTSHSFLMGIDEDGTSGYIFQAQTGNLAIVPNSSGSVLLYDGAGWRTLGTAQNRAQVLEFHLDDSGNLIECYRDGVFVGSDTYGASTGIDGSVAILSDNAVGANFFDGRLSEIWERDSLLTGADLFDVRSEMWTDHGRPGTPLIVPGHQSLIDPSNDSTISVAGGAVATAADVSGRGNDATAGTSPTHSQANDSIDYVAASSQYLQLMILNAAAGFMWGWWKETSGALGATLFGANDGSNSSFVGVRGAVYEWAYALGSASHNSGIPIVQNKWTFLGLWWNGTDAKLFVDAAVVSNANTGTAATIAANLGARNSSGVPGSFFDGSHGKVGALNRAPTAAEVAYIRQTTLRV